MKADRKSVIQCNLCAQAVDRVRHLRWKKDGYDILRCPGCGTLFRADLPTPEALREIYGPAYFADRSDMTGGRGYSDYVSEEANHRVNAATRVKLVERYLPTGRLLDVGCAAGFFLDEARRRGWRVEGIELAVEMAGYARDRLDLFVRPIPFADIELEPDAFDMITMWDYLEHSVDPAGDLRRAALLLRSGGLLAVSTGDTSSMAAQVFRSRWHLLTPRHHNFFFARSSLERAFREAGFEILLVTYASSLYSLQYLAHKLRTLTDWSILSALARKTRQSSFAGIALPINLFDIVTIVGRRA
jgi:2-polyprenyl-3-methyl-5-hydroxy-6-metoxy-1,4-benzoquinol methylase